MPSVSGAGERGALAIVLHTHMPYVEGFGTWPFGEEWLWEAIAGCYLPLLEVLERAPPVTLSLTPVLCDQLEAPGSPSASLASSRRCAGHTRADTAGLRAADRGPRDELERSWGDYERALERLGAEAATCSGALAPTQWTSSATHAILPLLATEAGLRAQVQSGVDAHRAPLRGEAGGGALAARVRLCALAAAALAEPAWARAASS